MKVCACCGKDIYVPYPTKYVYKRMHHTSARNQITDFYCGWNCMRKEEKIIDRICNELELPGC